MDRPTAEKLRSAMSRRERVAEKYLEKVRDFHIHNLPTDIDDMKTRVEELVRDGLIVDNGMKRRFRMLQRQADESQQFVERLNNDSGAIDPTPLLAAVESLQQSVFDHALLLVTARQGDVDFIRGISDDHRTALGILERKSVEERVSEQVTEVRADLRRRVNHNYELQTIQKDLEKEVIERNRRIDGLEADLDTKERALDAREARIRDQEERIAKLTEDVRDKGQLISKLEGQVSGLEGQVSGLKAEASAWKAEVLELEGQVSGLEGRVSGLKAEVSAWKAEVTHMEETADKQSSRASREKTELNNSLEMVRREKGISEQKAAGKELGWARSFAVRSGSDCADADSWVRFARVVADTNIVTGSIPKPIEGARPWILLPTWRREQDQQAHVPHSYSRSRAGIIDMAGSLYARALVGDCQEESLRILDSFTQRLFDDDSAPVEPFLLVVGEYVDYYADVDIDGAEAPVQLFFFGLWQAVSLVERVRSDRNAEEVRVCNRAGELISPLQMLADLPNINPEITMCEWAHCDDCIFSGDQDIGLVTIPLASGWVFVIHTADGSIRMIHNSRESGGPRRDLPADPLASNELPFEEKRDYP
ncbi:hypothetical protein F4818DRAFT_451830 [Hypoxylon cercidicola]|nr:hypothetical protein F4818DRAFT_451830 [Hypoxylon cercidicola]